MTQWRPIPSAPGYEASDQGEIRGPKGLRRQYEGKGGYLFVNLKISGRFTNRCVAPLVCEAFYGPAPEGHEADHRDEVRANNLLDNLRWLATPLNRGSRNIPNGESHSRARLTQVQVDELRRDYRDGQTKVWALKLKVKPGTIRDIVRGRCWRPEAAVARKALRESIA